MSSAPRGLAPREGLESCVDGAGPCWVPFEPRRRPQAGKSGDPRSQNDDRNLLAEIHAGLGGHHAVVLTELFPDALLDRSPGIVIELYVC